MGETVLPFFSPHIVVAVEVCQDSLAGLPLLLQPLGQLLLPAHHLSLTDTQPVLHHLHLCLGVM